MGLREGVTDGQLGDYTWRAMSYTWWVRGVTRGELDEVPPFGTIYSPQWASDGAVTRVS